MRLAGTGKISALCHGQAGRISRARIRSADTPGRTGMSTPAGADISVSSSGHNPVPPCAASSLANIGPSLTSGTGSSVIHSAASVTGSPSWYGRPGMMYPPSGSPSGTTQDAGTPVTPSPGRKPAADPTAGRCSPRRTVWRHGPARTTGDRLSAARAGTRDLPQRHGLTRGRSLAEPRSTVHAGQPGDAASPVAADVAGSSQAGTLRRPALIPRPVRDHKFSWLRTAGHRGAARTGPPEQPRDLMTRSQTAEAPGRVSAETSRAIAYERDNAAMSSSARISPGSEPLAPAGLRIGQTRPCRLRRTGQAPL